MDGRPYSIRVVCYFLICCSLDEKEEEEEEKRIGDGMRAKNGTHNNPKMPKEK